jgi:hypothetical protein
MNPFDAIYVINLASRPDRRAQMRTQLRRVGIDPDALPVVFFDAVRPAAPGGFPTIGARGCFLSHLGVLRDARAAGRRHILVLEDDLDFAADFTGRFPHMAAAAEGLGWDVWYLGALAVEPAPAAARADDDLVALSPDSVVLGTHMLALGADAIARLVPYLEAMLARPVGDPAGGPMHVDGAYGWFRRDHPALRTLLATPPLGHQRPSRTDVHALRWFDRLPGVHRAAALLRRARASTRRVGER